VVSAITEKKKKGRKGKLGARGKRPLGGAKEGKEVDECIRARVHQRSKREGKGELRRGKGSDDPVSLAWRFERQCLQLEGKKEALGSFVKGMSSRQEKGKSHCAILGRKKWGGWTEEGEKFLLLLSSPTL